MYILGICDSQDAGAVLLSRQSLEIIAVNEERLSRIKLQGGFPVLSIKEVLGLKKIKPEDISLVAAASDMTPAFILRLFSQSHAKLRSSNKQFSFLLAGYITYQVLAEKLIFPKKIEAFLSRWVLSRKLSSLGINAKVITIDHHTAHAYAGYSICGFDKALIITIDGLGDGVSFTVNIGQNGAIKPVFRQSALSDITLYYSRLTEFLGFKPIQDEGKVMGLAAYAEKYFAREQANKLLRVSKGRFKPKNPFAKDKKLFAQLSKISKQEVAGSFQKHAEDCLEKVVAYWVEKTGIAKVVLSGGFFANIKVNQKIAERARVEAVFICPHMGDGGLALGAAFSVKKAKPFQVKHVFWGPSYSDQQIQQTLEAMKIEYIKPKQIQIQIAELLSQKKIVARFSGAMEFGPRALGNRSILAQATDISMQNYLNQKLGRDGFMPFGPSILEEDKAICCLGIEKAEDSARFMNISFKATDYFQKTCPAAVHKDGTTRPQFVSSYFNNDFYKILKQYKQITNIPALLNTSFNLHEEPIVCSPQDAINSFQKSRIDYLAIGDFLVKRSNDEEKK
ncbi:MAG: carbamoyltransferase [Candidatus Omnitrophica bacterium]|nr:carbamoyltransferase [Candidatus Omnitrophota bacterium]